MHAGSISTNANTAVDAHGVAILDGFRAPVDSEVEVSEVLGPNAIGRTDIEGVDGTKLVKIIGRGEGDVFNVGLVVTLLAHRTLLKVHVPAAGVRETR